MRKATPHPDPIVRDLKAIRGLRWSEPEKFDELEVLLDHPATIHRAAKRKGAPERVKALRHLLEMTRTRFKQRENQASLRPVSNPSGVLLRLEAELGGVSVEKLNVEKLYRHIEWRKDNGKAMATGTFRAHREVRDFYEPFAAEFRQLAKERAEKYGFELRADGAAPAVSGPDEETKEGCLRRRLLAMEEETHGKRIHAIEEGTLKIRDEEEMSKILLMLTELAEVSLKAVDYTPIAEWSKPPLSEYLDFQLGEIADRKVGLERIHVVAARELEDEDERRKLKEFLERHASASATLLLCPSEAVERLELSFRPYSGLVLADDGDEPLAVTEKIGDGRVGRALVYTHETDEVSTLRAEYNVLKGDVTAQGHHRKLARQLTDPG